MLPLNPGVEAATKNETEQEECGNTHRSTCHRWCADMDIQERRFSKIAAGIGRRKPRRSGAGIDSRGMCYSGLY
ncbi:hypothetical protein DVU_1749 [Nitratidesulfovibrio vulgaris str. Hildenborough]|uniref:Uncharacterized protein n=1 Tax=Nitratidesulfovibrio vulgaris (strain ATCC 29579 / DSM 644 / CCUG 34227 / NCIMB 8303 / VKM B-1760 / Hildenborough) TaxID=882 RepID=Q72B87_NITV2|nr:hypothetical protein DVU_1749 [Nitratidesulfovibrio vulgaris str. Hildenborough]